MFNAHSFDELAARIGKAIENSPAKDIEKNVKAMLASGLARLDLVPRAEFDVQTRGAAQDPRKAGSAGEARRRVRSAVPAARRIARAARGWRKRRVAPRRHVGRRSLGGRCPRRATAHVARRRPVARPRRARRSARHRRGASRGRVARVQSRRPAGHRGQGIARSRARGAAERAVRVSGAQDHRQSRARRSPEGVRPLRSADRDRHSRGHGPGSRRRRCRTTNSPASWRWAARCGRSAARCRWRCPRGATAAPSCCRPRARRRRCSCAMRRSIPRRRCSRVCAHLTGRELLARLAASPERRPRAARRADLADVRGQEPAKRALTIAAAGVAQPVDARPARHGQVDARAAAAGHPAAAVRRGGARRRGDRVARRQVLARRPGARVRFAHRTTRRAPSRWSAAAAIPRPGEISLAHHGVLFLDELPEWDRRVLEVLREPLESGVIHISRAARQSTFPADFQFIAAMNPCPCGWLGHASERCHCTPDRIARYREPHLRSAHRSDRPRHRGAGARRRRRSRLAARRATTRPATVTSAQVRAEVTAARERQIARQGKPNARLGPREIEAHCLPGAAGAALLAQAMARLSLSARAYHRILKVARTIADLAGQSHDRGAARCGSGRLSALRPDVRDRDRICRCHSIIA